MRPKEMMWQETTYWLVGPVCLADSCGGPVDFLNHAGEVFAHLIQTFGELLGEFVSEFEYG
jgi:hypothetical protein